MPKHGVPDSGLLSASQNDTLAGAAVTGPSSDPSPLVTTAAAAPDIFDPTLYPTAASTPQLVAVAAVVVGPGRTVVPGTALDLPSEEGERLVALGLARWEGAAPTATPYDESIKAAEADARAEAGTA